MNRVAHPEANERPLEAFTHHWRRMHDQAAELAALAGLAQEPHSDALATFPERLFECGADKRALAWQGVDDIDAMLQPGLVALRTIAARGQSAGVPAMALWREFYRAREAVLALADANWDRAA